MRATVLLALAACTHGGAVGRTHLFGAVRSAKDDGERAEPRVKLSCGVKPRIKLRKSIEELLPPQPLPAPPSPPPFPPPAPSPRPTCRRLPHRHRPRHRPRRHRPHRHRPDRHRPHRPHRRRHRPQALGTTLSFGAEYHVREKEAHVETTWHDPRLVRVRVRARVRVRVRVGVRVSHLLSSPRRATFILTLTLTLARLGGQLSLRDLATLEWRKTWLFPGIADAATRVEVRSTLDARRSTYP